MFIVRFISELRAAAMDENPKLQAQFKENR